MNIEPEVELDSMNKKNRLKQIVERNAEMELTIFEVPPKLGKNERITGTAPTPKRLSSVPTQINYFNEVEIYDSYTQEMIIDFDLPNTEILTNIKNVQEKPFLIFKVAETLSEEESAEIKSTIEATVLSSRTVTRLFINQKDAKRLRRVLKEFYSDARFTANN